MFAELGHPPLPDRYSMGKHALSHSLTANMDPPPMLRAVVSTASGLSDRRSEVPLTDRRPTTGASCRHLHLKSWRC